MGNWPLILVMCTRHVEYMSIGVGNQGQRLDIGVSGGNRYFVGSAPVPTRAYYCVMKGAPYFHYLY